MKYCASLHNSRDVEDIPSVADKLLRLATLANKMGESDPTTGGASARLLEASNLIVEDIKLQVHEDA
jgi:hypothetical protein